MTSHQFGQTLRKLRRRQGMTQRDLALVINAGERFIVDLEAGKPTAQLGKALAAAQAVGWHLASPDDPAL
jgi:y4mF family transcriptional regulator